MTAADKPKIDAALESTGGDYDAAAALLGVNRNELVRMIDRFKDLKSRWYKPAFKDDYQQPVPPTEIETLDRPYDDTYEGDRVLPTERQLVEAITNEDALVRKRMEKMGLKDSEIQVAQSCREFAQKHFAHILQTMAGGVAKASIKIQSQLSEVEDRLNCVRGVLKEFDQLRPADRDAWVEEETRLSNMYVQLLGELRRNWEIGNKGAAIIAMIRRQNNYRPSRNGLRKVTFSAQPIDQ